MLDRKLANGTEVSAEGGIYKALRYRSPEVKVETSKGGAIILSSPIPVTDVGSIAALFKRQTAAHPQRTWLAQRDDADAWVKITYQDFDRQSDAIAQWFLNCGMGQNTPVMVISGNSIGHALFVMAALKAQVPVSSISEPYALRDKSFKKLNHVLNTVKPVLVYAESALQFADALEYVKHAGAKVVVKQSNPEVDAVSLEEIAITEVTAEVLASIGATAPGAAAKYFFTSGSTGLPKAVVHTQSMLTAQASAVYSLIKPEHAYCQNDYPKTLQWMPWSHVSAGNMSYHEAMVSGGTIYIDAGRPVPGLFDQTIRNLKEISPTAFGSAPIGFMYLADALERDVELCSAFFKNLEMMVYGGAALPRSIADRIQKIAIEQTGTKIPLTTGYGATETQGVAVAYWCTEDTSLIGLPFPGVSIKLVPKAGKVEICAKGPAVFKEYLGEPKRTHDSFDNEGFYALGDAAKFRDPESALKGLMFNGRISEDFKLLSGTWVNAASIREDVLSACQGIIRDIVVCGENKIGVTLMAWLSPSKVELVEGTQDIVQSPAVAEQLNVMLSEYNRKNPGTSSCIVRMILLGVPPSLDQSEITDKGYINPSAVVANRPAALARLYDADTCEKIIFSINESGE